MVCCDLLSSMQQRLQGRVVSLTRTHTHAYTHTVATHSGRCSLRCVSAAERRCKRSLQYVRKQDVLVFNPPYVPTSSSEMRGDGIERSWAGGARGREVLDRLLPHVDALLSADGVLFLVLIAQNDPDDVRRRLSAARLHSDCVLRKRAGAEDLQVIMARRERSPD